MGKTVGIILTTLGSAALIATGVGAVGGIALFGSTAGITVAGATLGQLALASSALTGLGTMVGGGAGAPKTNTSSTSIKISRPDRKAGYGESRLYGAYILYETGSNGAAIDGFAVHDGRMTSPVAFYLGDDKVTHQVGVTYPGGLINGLSDGRYSDDTTRFYWTDGRAPGTTIPLIIADLPGVWSSNHRGDDVCLIYTRFASVKSKNFLTRYPSGVPTASIAARWQKCPDPWAADPCDDTAWTWTENPVRQMMHYMLYREAPKPTIPHDDPAYYAQMLAMRVAYYNRKIAPSIASWRAASDVCDEPIALKGGGTEARYRSCLSHSLTTSNAEVKAGLLALCDGWMATQSDGSVAIHAGKLQTPTVTIGDEHIIAYEWEGVGVDDDQAVNELVCSYVSTAHDYNSVECDAWRNETDILERGALLSDSLDLQTPSWGQVRRIAKRRMGRTNALYRGVVTTNIAGRIARGQRYINLHLAEAGTVFFDGVAEITGVTRNSATGGITFSWVAVDPNADAWNPATEEGEPAALGDRVALTPLPAPTITTATAELGDGGSTARIRITVDGFDRDDITWFARWRITSDTTWNEQEYSDIDPGPSAVLLTSLVALDVAIDVQVAYSVGDGRVSPWSALESVSTSTAGLAPSPPTGVSGTGGTLEADIDWTNAASTNLAYSRVYRNSANSYSGSTLVSGDLASAPGAAKSFRDEPAAGGWYYFVRGFNASGTGSSPVGTGLVTVV